MTDLFAMCKEYGMEHSHPLAAWLKKKGERRADFARRIEASEAHLSLIISWKRGPSLDMAARIEKATKGSVRAVDLLKPEVVQ